MLGDEARVGFGAVGADAYDHAVCGDEIIVRGAKFARFGRAAWGVILGVKIQRDPLACEVL